MRHSEFWESMDHAFGKAYAKSLAADMVMGRLGGLTAEQALDAGAPPREVWDALCDVMEVDDNVRWHYRDAPKKRRRR
jgi:hypothetical protein